MSKITIGETPSGKPLRLDLDLLIPSRLLIQANSGGGKSWLLRLLAEQLYGRVQTIIIDPEGEFFTLRDKFGYVLVGEGGETPADVRSAELLVEKFLQLKASAVCDLYEAFRSRPMERRQWVRTFLTALIDAPRSLWHPLIVIVDEAHKFCPQESPKAATARDREIIQGCKDAMIALSTTGRKRGFCPLWATQRLAKLDKDASAEFFNRLVGMTIEDVDVDRAADLMSVSRDQKQEFRQSLRSLQPGEFYAFGRAITLERTLVKVGPVLTRHPETGKQAAGSSAPPMPDDVKKFLPQLSDLPKEAEQKVRTVAELEQTIRELRLELRKKESAAPAKSDPADRKTIAQLQSSANKLAKFVKMFRELKVDNSDVYALLERKRNQTLSMQSAASVLLSELGFQSPGGDLPVPPRPASPTPITRRQVQGVNLSSDDFARAPGEGSKIGDLHRQVAGILAGYFPEAIKSSVLAALVGRTVGGSWSGRLSEMRTAGLIEDPAPGMVRATENCAKEFFGAFQAPRSAAEVRAIWDPKLGAPHRAMLDLLVERAGDAVSKEELAQAAGLVLGGSFSGRLSELRSTGLIVDIGRGLVAANKETLLLEGASARRSAVVREG